MISVKNVIKISVPKRVYEMPYNSLKVKKSSGGTQNTVESIKFDV